jgi:hypothetical protein
MTAARQERKSRPRGIFLARPAAFWGLFTLLAGFCLVPASIRAATTELVVTNRYTGLAIDGFDPVAYFVDEKPLPGRAELELRAAGATWRFRNDGNRAAFAAAPGVYMPRYGGHDPVAIARGVARPGNPGLWLIADKRLYFFYSAHAQAAFAANPGAAIEAAERNWPAVQRALVP